MLDSLTNAWAAGKEGAFAAAAKVFLNRKVDKFGSITNLQLDSKQKNLAAELVLKGESTPILIQVDAYEVDEKDGVAWLTVRGIHASREWLNAALNEFLVGRPLQIPAIVRRAL